MAALFRSADTDGRLKDLETFQGKTVPRLTKLEDFRTSAKEDIVNLRKFKNTTVDRLGRLENFRTEIVPWKSETEKRLGELEKKRVDSTWKNGTDKRLADLERKGGDFDAWNGKVDGLLIDLEKNKLNIDAYNADKNKLDARVDELEDFKGKMTSIFSRDQGKNESRLDALEQRVKGLEDGTATRDEKTDKCLKDVTDRVEKVERMQDDCSKELITGFSDLERQIKKVRIALSPITSTEEDGKPRYSALPAPVVLPLFNTSSSCDPLAIPSFLRTVYPSPPIPPTLSPSGTHHIHHYHDRSSRRHSSFYCKKK